MDWLLARQPGIECRLAAAGRVGELGRELSRWLGTGALPPEAEEPLRSPGRAGRGTRVSLVCCFEVPSMTASAPSSVNSRWYCSSTSSMAAGRSPLALGGMHQYCLSHGFTSFFQGLPHGPVRDRVDGPRPARPVRQQLHRPPAPPLRRLRAGEGHQLRPAPAVEAARLPVPPLAADQRRLQTLPGAAAAHPPGGRHAGLQDRRDAGTGAAPIVTGLVGQKQDPGAPAPVRAPPPSRRPPVA